MWTAVDELAEHIRALGDYAPSSYSEMAALSSIVEETGQPDWRLMVTNLAEGQHEAAKSAREVLRVAEDVGDDATADVVAPMITLHEKNSLNASRDCCMIVHPLECPLSKHLLRFKRKYMMRVECLL